MIYIIFTTMASFHNLFLTCFVEIIILVTVSSTDPKIIDSAKALKGQIPYQASLKLENIHICSAAIVNDRHVVTAGNCVVIKGTRNTTQPVEKLKVDVGTITRSGSDGMSYSVEAIHIPKGYNLNPYVNSGNVAVLRIKGNFSINEYVLPISISAFVNNPDIGCTISGWNEVDPEPLYYGITKIMNKTTCGTIVTSNLAFHVLCAAYNMEGFNTCKGDKGAPLVCNYTLTGIASHCGPDGILEIYTDLHV